MSVKFCYVPFPVPDDGLFRYYIVIPQAPSTTSYRIGTYIVLYYTIILQYLPAWRNLKKKSHWDGDFYLENFYNYLLKI